MTVSRGLRTPSKPLSTEEKQELTIIQKELDRIRVRMRYFGYPLWKQYLQGNTWALIPGKVKSTKNYRKKYGKNKEFKRREQRRILKIYHRRKNGLTHLNLVSSGANSGITQHV